MRKCLRRGSEDSGSSDVDRGIVADDKCVGMWSARWRTAEQDVVFVTWESKQLAVRSSLVGVAAAAEL